MGVTNRLLYDPTDANTKAASSTVGAYVLDADGNVIDGSNPLSVDIGSVTDLDIRDLSHTQDSVKIGDGTEFVAVNVDGSINAVVTATDLDIRSLTAASDSVAAWTNDGSGNAIGSTSNALDVYLTNPIGEIDIDDDLANVAIENTATGVSTSAVSVVSSALANRKWLYLMNNGNKSLYIGKSGVTTVNGWPLSAGMAVELRLGPTPVCQAIGGTGASSEDLRVMELS